MLSSLLIRDVAVMIEQKHQPNLKHMPIILLTGNKRLKVLALDVLARNAGVQIGMTRKQAELLCPNAEFIPAREDVYRRIFFELTDNLLNFAEKIEPKYQASNALWYVNTSNTKELTEMAKKIHSVLGISVSIGSATTKFVARVASATVVESEYRCSVARGDEAEFLAPYPTSLLPLNRDMERRLPMMGIHTLGQYAALSRAAVFEQWGKHGHWCHDLAYGIDPYPLQSYRPEPIFSQTIQLDDPITDKERLITICLRLATWLIQQLDDCEAQRLILILNCEDGSTHEVHLEPSVAIRDIWHIQRQLPLLLEKSSFSTDVTSLTLQLTGIQAVTPTQLSLFDFAKNQKTLNKALEEWEQRFHETIYQPNLISIPRLYPPEMRVEYAVVSA